MNPLQIQILRKIRTASVFVSGLILIGCHDVPQQINDPPASPCPNPNIDTTRWPAIAMPECGVILKLPKRYKDRGSNTYNDWWQHSYGNRFDSVIVFFTRQEDAALPKNRSAAPDDYEGYSTCNEAIGGNIAVITTYRDSATIRGKPRSFRPYGAEARWKLAANEFVRVEASNASRDSQEEVLAALRTVQFIPRSWPLPSNGQSALIEYIKIIAGLRIQLMAYALVIGGGGYLIFRRKARTIPITSRRRRVSLAAYFALILTPSVLTDFFLFSAPAPALLAFFAMLPSLFYIEYWWGKAYATLVLYVGPILLSFGILYALLTLYARVRAKRGASLSGVS